MTLVLDIKRTFSKTLLVGRFSRKPLFDFHPECFAHDTVYHTDQRPVDIEKHLIEAVEDDGPEGGLVLALAVGDVVPQLSNQLLKVEDGAWDVAGEEEGHYDEKDSGLGRFFCFGRGGLGPQGVGHIDRRS